MKRKASLFTSGVCALLMLTASAQGAWAAKAAALPPAPTTGSGIDTSANHVVLMDGDTGEVLWEKDGETPMHPASMSKLMTLSVLFDALKAGKVKLDDKFTVSQRAWKEGGAVTESSTMFLKIGDQVAVQDLIQGIIVQSGNDACITVAEGLAGSEEAFVDLENKRGKEIGLTQSTFRNSTGWPDPEHLMSAHDLAIVARHLIYDFPDYYHFFSEKEFTWNGITQGNRNPLLYTDPSVDGLKTGHTSQSGFGLTVSSKRNGQRMILVVNGLPSMQARADEPRRILDWAFRSFRSYKLFDAGASVETIPVWQGVESKVDLVTTTPVSEVLSIEQRAALKVTVVYDLPARAPIAKGQQLATLRMEVPGKPARDVPLVAANSVERLGFFGRAAEAFHHLIFGSK